MVHQDQIVSLIAEVFLFRVSSLDCRLRHVIPRPKIVIGFYPQLIEDLQLPIEKDLTIDIVVITEYIIGIDAQECNS